MKLMKKFPSSVIDKLKFHVYIYSDPRDNTIFYVGKGAVVKQRWLFRVPWRTRNVSE